MRQERSIRCQGCNSNLASMPRSTAAQTAMHAGDAGAAIPSSERPRLPGKHAVAAVSFGHKPTGCIIMNSNSASCGLTAHAECTAPAEHDLHNAEEDEAQVQRASLQRQQQQPKPMHPVTSSAPQCSLASCVGFAAVAAARATLLNVQTSCDTSACCHPNM